jgi:lipoate-protein ligase A
MRLLDLTLPSAAENLALDELLLLEAEAGRAGEVLRFWECPHLAVVLGAGGILRDDISEEACASDGVPILRRSSGGGTVLLGPGCLCYSVVLSYKRAPEFNGIHSSYSYILSLVAQSLADLVPGIAPTGISDLAVDGRKVSGNAQQRKRHFLLHHGTLFYTFALSLLTRYLREPVRRPEYRGQRLHVDFVQNLPCSREQLCARLGAVWGAAEESPEYPVDEVARLVQTKYGNRVWNERR